MKRHQRDNYFILHEGIYLYDHATQPKCTPAGDQPTLRKFRFSRMGPQTKKLPSQPMLEKLAQAMTAQGAQADSTTPTIPAGFTYLGQFVDHDLTFDRTAKALGENVTIAELVQGRSPALDLDCLYGRGPHNAEDAVFYSDGIRLKTGSTAAVPFPDGGTNRDIDGFDLPRRGTGSKKSDRRAALIPDPRNDENLAVAQTHLAFIHFHNRVVEKLAREGTPSALLFTKAREMVIKHYQWMLRTDFLPRIVDQATLNDVFANGRRIFETAVAPGDMPTMPVEFSVAAYRLGHSMIRAQYSWNRVFEQGGPGGVASLALLFQFSGTSGILSPPPADLNDPEAGDFERLPTNWIVDWARLHDFSASGIAALSRPAAQFNITQKIDSALVNPLDQLPLGSFGPRGSAVPPIQMNLAFRNLMRGRMVKLASGQEMVEFMRAQGLAVTPLTAAQILGGSTDTVGLNQAQKKELVESTPLWFYILKEAELNNGLLKGVGARIVAETFHRAMQGSDVSALRDQSWRPTLGPDANTFTMADLLLFAFDRRPDLLNPLG